MINLKVFPKVDIANKLKDKALSGTDNFPFYIEAAVAFQAASDELKAERNADDISVYKENYRLWYLSWLTFQVNDCMYDYYKLQKEYKEATPYFGKALAEINKLNEIIGINIQLLSGAIDYDSRQYHRFKALVGYNYYSYRLKTHEFTAKKYFEHQNYLLALQEYHASLQAFDILANYMDKNQDFIDKGYFSVHDVNKNICAINYAMALIGSIRDHHYVTDGYYILSIIVNLVEALDKAGELIKLRPNEPMYQNGQESVLLAIDDVLIAYPSFWSVILDKLRDNELVNMIMAQIDPQFYAETRSNLSQTPPSAVAVVFLVHGFNTRGEWKSTLTSVLSTPGYHKRFIPENFDFGHFVFRFINPFSRGRVTRKFKEFYNHRMGMYYNLSPEAYLVGHSFGTYLTSQCMLKFPEVNFDKIIYLGSILRRDFKWFYPRSQKPNLLVRFELQRADWALKCAYLYSLLPWVNWLGDSGRKGFNTEYDFIAVYDYLYGGHSDMFGELHMRQNWLPFLLE